MGTWHRIPCLKESLNLKATLSGGQSFRWRESNNGEWTGVVGKFVLKVRWGQDKGNGQTHLEFCALGGKAAKITASELQSRISSYFRLDTNLEKLYEQWANCDPNFKVKATRSDLKGIRILNQERVENIFSFICSSNNNIARISSMVENLCMLFGQEICTIDSKKYYSFPEVKDLVKPNIEVKLRKVGFGYRAPFVIGTAKKIIEQGGEDWLLKLSEMDYANTKQELMSLPGIGAKVADCICLMSFGHLQAVPVDTHVYQIAVASYTPHLAGRKSQDGLTRYYFALIFDHFKRQKKEKKNPNKPTRKERN
ncbi:hypothetical protein B566_EDAN001278 [Ephemera danica]|nr:hypothetical protein B566_EDAN001278 [Ephemera danica]